MVCTGPDEGLCGVVRAIGLSICLLHHLESHRLVVLCEGGVRHDASKCVSTLGGDCDLLTLQELVQGDGIGGHFPLQY